MAVIVKADIIEDVNENLRLKLDEDSTELDRAINKTLKDMSKRGLLRSTDTSQTLIDGSKSLNYPTGYRSAISITLTDSSDNANYPLDRLPGGLKEYRERIAFSGNLVNPEWYAESEAEKKIFLYGQASKSYTTLIEYRKNHAKDPDNIEFSDDFENLMFAGVTYFKALALSRISAITLWLPAYANELRLAMLDRNQQPSMMKG